MDHIARAKELINDADKIYITHLTMDRRMDLAQIHATLTTAEAIKELTRLIRGYVNNDRLAGEEIIEE